MQLYQIRAISGEDEREDAKENESELSFENRSHLINGVISILFEADQTPPCCPWKQHLKEILLIIFCLVAKVINLKHGNA